MLNILLISSIALAAVCTCQHIQHSKVKDFLVPKNHAVNACEYKAPRILDHSTR